MDKIKIEYVDPATLLPYEKNPRINDHAVAAVRKSIEDFGFNVPMVVRQEDNVICTGHTRWKAAIEIGLKKVPVVFKPMTESQFKAFNLADNKTAQKASWDDELLREILTELRDEQVDLKSTGFEDKELMALLGIEKSDLHIKESFEGDDDFQIEDGLNTTPSANVKSVQLFFTSDQMQNFVAKCQQIQEANGFDSMSQAVYEVICGNTPA